MMAETSRQVLARLAEMEIPYSLHHHAPAATMADCLPIAEHLHAVMPKNLFLMPRRAQAHVLCFVSPDAQLRTSGLSAQLGLPRLQFAPADVLFAKLACPPGAISPLGLLLPGAEGVRFAMDRALQGAPMLAMHPCVPDATVALAAEDFSRMLTRLNVEIEWIDM